MQRALTVFQLDKVPDGHELWLQESLNKVSSVEQAVSIADKHQIIAGLAKKAGCTPTCEVKSMQHWAPLSIMYQSLQSSSNNTEKLSNEERLGYANPTAFVKAVAAEMGERCMPASHDVLQLPVVLKVCAHPLCCYAELMDAALFAVIDHHKLFNKIFAACWFVHQLGIAEPERVETIPEAAKEWKKHCKDLVS